MKKFFEWEAASLQLMARCLSMALAVGGVFLLGGCATTGTASIDPDPRPDRGAGQVPDAVQPALPVREHELLLMLEDRRLYEAFAVNTALAGEPPLRSRLALALGRAGDPAAVPVLEELVRDPNPAVRRSAAFGLATAAGLGALLDADVRAGSIVWNAMRDDDLETARWAAIAFARSTADGTRLAQALAQRAEGVIDPEAPPSEAEIDFWARLLPALAVLESSQTSRDLARAAYQRLAGYEVELAGVALAILLEEDPAASEHAEHALSSSDPWTRSLAWTFIGRHGPASTSLRETALARPATEDLDLAEVREAASIVAALARQVERGVVAPAPEIASVLAALLDHPALMVRFAALEAARFWLPEPTLTAALRERVEAADAGLPKQSASSAVREGAVALLSLAAGSDNRAADLIRRCLRSGHTDLRAAAAAAAVLTADRELLGRLEEAPEPLVQVALMEAWVEALLRYRPPPWDPALREAVQLVIEPRLLGNDSGVRSAAWALAARYPVLPVESLAAGLQRLAGNLDETLESRLQAVSAFDALARAERLERGAAIAKLEELAEDPSWPVRRAATAALRALDRQVDRPARPVAHARQLYREWAERFGGRRMLEMVTEEGVLRFELDCSLTPQACSSVFQLAAQGYYDDLVFEGGEPGRMPADSRLVLGNSGVAGWRSPGYRIRDEPTPEFFLRAGVLTLERLAPDAGAAGLSVTLEPRPQATASEVALGRLMDSDFAILARLGQGSRVHTVREGRSR